MPTTQPRTRPISARFNPCLGKTKFRGYHLKTMKRIPATITTASIAAVIGFLAATLDAGPAHAELLSENKTWAAYREGGKGGAFCFVTAQPTKDVGKYKIRGDIFAVISHHPQENRINEFSIQAGYTYQKGSVATASIDGKTTFELFTDGGNAWTFDKKSDNAVVKAMRGGATMVVRGTSSRGTATTDTYSLSGFTAAWKAAAKACGIK